MDVGQQSSKQGRVGDDLINVRIDVGCAGRDLGCCTCRSCCGCGNCGGRCECANVVDQLITLQTLAASACLGELVAVVALDAERGGQVGNEAIAESGGLSERERKHSDQQQGSLHRLIIL